MKRDAPRIFGPVCYGLVVARLRIIPTFRIVSVRTGTLRFDPSSAATCVDRGCGPPSNRKLQPPALPSAARFTRLVMCERCLLGMEWNGMALLILRTQR